MLSSVDALQERARNILLKLLERGPKTSMQLRDALLKQDIPESIADELIARFQEVELVDDRGFAQSVSDATRRSKGTSRQMVKRKLADKGLDRELIDQVAASISDEDEQILANELAIKRFGQLSQYTGEVRTRRLVGFLQRRGFSSQVVFAAIREAENQAVKSEV
jgi:regulatory protein